MQNRTIYSAIASQTILQESVKTKRNSAPDLDGGGPGAQA